MARSPELDAIIAMLREMPILDPDIEVGRALMTPDALGPLPEGIIETATTLAGRTCVELVPDGYDTEGELLWLHGGGYCIGSAASHRGLGASLTTASNRRVHLLDYRLAPENPFPAAVDDAVTALGSLIDRHGADRVAIGGDSAGGGLAVAAQIARRDQGLERPSAAICISPWADLTISAESYTTRADADPMATAEGLRRMAGHYLGGTDAKEPLASPVFGHLAGLAPHLIVVGTAEVLLDDSRALTAALHDHDVPAVLSEWDDMIHVFPAFGDALPEAGQAIELIADFLENPPA